jgi:signal transduction histidine kinase/CheY-like chemotaxis protein
MSVRAKIFLIIMSIIVVITASSVFISILFAEDIILKTIENDMRLVASLADELVSEELHLLEIHAGTAARRLLQAPEEDREGLLRELVDGSETFSALGIFHSSGRLELFYGKEPFQAEPEENEFWISGSKEGMLISSGIRDSLDNLVFYVRLPMGDGFLGAVLPGMFFSELVSDFRIWETGHITIDDGEGTVIANIRPEWVNGRINFIRLAKNDSRYEPIAQSVMRMTAGETGIARFSIGGVERISAYRPVRGSKQGWSLAVIAPINESPAAGVRLVLFAAALVFFGLGSLAALLASGSISRPWSRIQVQNTRLSELNREAQSASEAKSKFLANMSHEMRTPLNAVIGLSELSLRNDKAPPAVEENLEKIYSSALILLGIVNDLLDISKIESGKFEILCADYHLPSFINDTINLNIVRLGSKPVSFHLLIDENLPSRLNGDELRIKQIFNNLLSNAFKYTQEGKVEWMIRAERDPPGGDTVWLISEIRDTGIGIKAEDREKLFTDYERLDTKKNRNLEGTGLGLALTKNMAEFMQGSITVQSEYGKGSVFTVRLRQRYVDGETIGPKLAENLGKFRYADAKLSRNIGLERIQMPYARVLVVDDIDINLDVAQGLLEGYGMKVDRALSGWDAVEMVRREDVRYNAIFMDHMMPVMDGIETVKIIREAIDSEYARTVPIIALTANALAGSVEMFLNNGFQDFLSKPIEILRLDAVVRRWVRDKELEKSSRL